MREMLAITLNIQLDIEMIKNKLDSQDQDIELLLNYLNELMEKHNIPESRNPGFTETTWYITISSSNLYNIKRIS